jgi:hypothetical protein
MSNGTTDLTDALKKAAGELAKQISDASELRVETLWVLADENGDVTWEDAKPVALTTIQLDGDSKLILPLKKEGESTVVRRDLLEIHDGNVQNARAYREKIYDMIMEAVRETGGW